MSEFAKSFFVSSWLGSIPLFIIATRLALISKPITFTFLANANAIGKPTYPNPITATVAFLSVMFL